MMFHKSVTPLQHFLKTLAQEDISLEHLRQLLNPAASLERLWSIVSTSEYVSPTDILKFLSRNDQNSAYLAELVVKSYDKDKDGVLSKRELKSLLKPINQSIQFTKRISDSELREHLRQLLKGELSLAETVEGLRRKLEADPSFSLIKAFEFVTKGGSSCIDKEQLVAFLCLTGPEAEVVMRRFDKDNDSKLSFSELDTALMTTAPKIKLKQSPGSILKINSPDKRKSGRQNSVHFDEAQLKADSRDFDLKSLTREPTPLPGKLTPSSPMNDTPKGSAFIGKSKKRQLKRLKKTREATLSNASSSTNQSDSPDLTPELVKNHEKILFVSPFSSSKSLSDDSSMPDVSRLARGLVKNISGYNGRIEALIQEILELTQSLENMKKSLASRPDWNVSSAFSLFDTRGIRLISILDIHRACTNYEVEISIYEIEAVVKHLTSGLTVNLYFQHFKHLLASVDTSSQLSSRNKLDLDLTQDPTIPTQICLIIKKTARLIRTSSQLNASITSFRRFSLSNCYASSDSSVPKESFMRVMSSLGVYSKSDANVKLNDRRRHASSINR